MLSWDTLPQYYCSGQELPSEQGVGDDTWCFIKTDADLLFVNQSKCLHFKLDRFLGQGSFGSAFMTCFTPKTSGTTRATMTTKTCVPAVAKIGIITSNELHNSKLASVVGVGPHVYREGECDGVRLSRQNVPTEIDHPEELLRIAADLAPQVSEPIGYMVMRPLTMTIRDWLLLDEHRRAPQTQRQFQSNVDKARYISQRAFLQLARLQNKLGYHNDCKSDNMMLLYSESVLPTVFVIDFGLSVFCRPDVNQPLLPEDDTTVLDLDNTCPPPNNDQCGWTGFTMRARDIPSLLQFNAELARRRQLHPVEVGLFAEYYDRLCLLAELNDFITVVEPNSVADLFILYLFDAVRYVFETIPRTKKYHLPLPLEYFPSGDYDLRDTLFKHYRQLLYVRQ